MTPLAFWIRSGRSTRPEQALPTRFFRHIISHAGLPMPSRASPIPTAFSPTWPSPHPCGVEMYRGPWVKFSFVGPDIFQLFAIKVINQPVLRPVSAHCCLREGAGTS